MIEPHDVLCDLCQNSNADFLFDAKDRLYGCEGTFTYVKCKNCGLVYMNPQVSTDDIEKFYPEDYLPYQAKKESEGRNSLTAKLKNSPTVKAFRNIRKRLFNNVKIIPSIRQRLNKQSRLLDVGCGSGKFLNQIRSDINCQVCGVDISETAAKAAKNSFGINIFNGPITKAEFPANSFDIITAWWYLEHVTGPSKALQKMHSLLKDDGFCVIGVPNFDSFNAKIFKDRWYHLDCPRHLYIYSPATITKLLNKAGFVVTKILFDKRPRGLLHSLQYYFGNDSVPLKHRKKPRGLSLLKKLLLPLTILLALLRQSDTMVVYAQKERRCLKNTKTRACTGR